MIGAMYDDIHGHKLSRAVDVVVHGTDRWCRSVD